MREKVFDEARLVIIVPVILGGIFEGLQLEVGIITKGHSVALRGCYFSLICVISNIFDGSA